MATILNIKVNDQELFLLNRPIIASGGVEEDKVRFVFDDTWNGLEKTAVFYNYADEKYEVKLNKYNETLIPAFVISKAGILNICLYGEAGDLVKTSEVIKYRIKQGATSDNVDPLEKYKEKWEAETKGNLANALEHSAEASELEPMPDYQDMSMDELVGEISNNLILTEEKKEKISDYGMLSDAIEKIALIPAILTRNNGIAEPYSVPYLHTIKVGSVIKTNEAFNPYLTDFGFDVSGAIRSDFLTTYGGANDSIFQYDKNLEHVKITGLESQIKLAYLFSGLTNLKSVELYGFNKNSTSSNVNILAMFKDCTKLEYINYVDGKPTEELDFTGHTGDAYWDRVFSQCVSLKEIRVKPFSLQMNYGFQHSSLLSKESVLSIINGLDEAVDGMKLAVNQWTKTRMDEWRCSTVQDEETGFIYLVDDDNGEYSYAEAVTIHKGWTLQ